jgi:Ca2+/Na+ antiporter
MSQIVRTVREIIIVLFVPGIIALIFMRHFLTAELLIALKLYVAVMFILLIIFIILGIKHNRYRND